MSNEESGSEQAAEAGDVLTESTAGMVDVSLRNDATKNEEAKQKRISDAEWQSMKEELATLKKGAGEIDKLKNEAKKEALTEIVNRLGIKEDDETLSPEEVLERRIAQLELKNAQLEEQSSRIGWELKNPDLMATVDPERWQKFNKDEKYRVLSYEEKAYLARRKDTEKVVAIAEEARKQEHNPYDGVVPVVGKRADLINRSSGMDAEIAAAMGWTDEDYERAGVKRP